MARPQYRVITLDLATARAAVPIVDVGSQYDGVTVLGITGASSVSLHFATNGEPVPVTTGDSYEVSAEKDGCPVPANEGLYVTNTAAAGTLTLLVSHGTIARVA